MRETTLLRITMLIAIAGLFLLFIISKVTAFPEQVLLDEDNSYTVQGEIKRITERDKVTFITLNKVDELTVVLFKDYPVDLHQGEYIEVIGKATKDQEDNLQLVSKEIRIIK
ncbi:MAG TPA: OB-fold nucleic acid binding domain-containing protein [Candidatus Nanoarchaeia archaeon]|nr:OB-fold nucleic acid binding domain-containing protein [Candidatus Nanoarchaeia archaeon]